MQGVSSPPRGYDPSLETSTQHPSGLCLACRILLYTIFAVTFVDLGVTLSGYSLLLTAWRSLVEMFRGSYGVLGNKTQNDLFKAYFLWVELHSGLWTSTCVI